MFVFTLQKIRKHGNLESHMLLESEDEIEKMFKNFSAAPKRFSISFQKWSVAHIKNGHCSM